MINITKDNFTAEVEEAEDLVVLDFYAEWCAPCSMLAPILAELEAEYPDVRFGKVNVDSERLLMREFAVQSIPFVAFVKDNTFLDFSEGYVPKERLSAMIEEYK